MQHISDMHSKFALRPHHVWKYGRHPMSDRWEQVRKKRGKKKIETTAANIMSTSATQGGHNNKIMHWNNVWNLRTNTTKHKLKLIGRQINLQCRLTGKLLTAINRKIIFPWLTSRQDGLEPVSMRIRKSKVWWFGPLIDWVKVLNPTRHKLGHFGDALPSQSRD